MATAEDCASVLEQFIHDAGNLPQEINHHFEELSAKDVEMLKSLQLINNRDNALQKHIKHHGTQTRHPKEQEFAESINQHYQTAIELQGQKIALTEKASTLLERQLKRLDVQIKTLQNDGQLVETWHSVCLQPQACSRQGLGRGSYDGLIAASTCFA